MDRIFIDSGAFVAWLSRADRHHARAAELFEQLVRRNAQLVTTNLIVNETCSWLLRNARPGHTTAAAFGDYVDGASVALEEGPLPAARGLFVVYSSPQIERCAWEIFKKYDTAGFSLTDCVSFAAMQMLDITRAFTFDSHFDVMGFQRL